MGNNRSKKNKGFSLVELIVVIAVMAVLVGVLAPAYLRYVDKSRVQKDISAMGEVLAAIETASHDEEIMKEIPMADEYTMVTIAGETGVITTEADAPKLKEAIIELLDSSVTFSHSTCKKLGLEIAVWKDADMQIHTSISIADYNREDVEVANEIKEQLPTHVDMNALVQSMIYNVANKVGTLISNYGDWGALSVAGDLLTIGWNSAARTRIETLATNIYSSMKTEYYANRVSLEEQGYDLESFENAVTSSNEAVKDVWNKIKEYADRQASTQ